MPQKFIDTDAFFSNISQNLREAGFNFQEQPIVGNAQPDFLIQTPEGHDIVVEVKQWEPTSENIVRAMNQVKSYKNLTKASEAILVIADLKESIPEKGVISVDELINRIFELSEELSKSKKSKKSTKVKAVKPKKNIKKFVFASMPFDGKYDDTFLVAMRPAAIQLNYSCDRVDHDGTYGDIVKEIKKMINKSVAVIADLSESRPSVMHEVGYAEARKIPIIQISSTDLNQLPFNVRNNTTISYDIGQTARLRGRIKRKLERMKI